MVDQAQLVEEVARAMVGIGTESTSGSGFIFDSLGWVITNSSVVENVETVAVAFTDGSTERGTVIGRYGYVDLAVVRIEAERSFPAFIWANQDSVFDSDEVLALGLNSSDGGWLVSLSGGSITSKGPCPSGFYPQDPSVECIQTDASINSGNAGGPMINLLERSSASTSGVQIALKTPATPSHLGGCESTCRT